MKRVLWLSFRSLLCLSLVFFLASCKKKSPPLARPVPLAATPVTAPPDRPAAAPTVEISASPSTVERGQQSTLNWRATHAASVQIDGGVGNVAAAGSVVISPRESTTYTATASGPGGEAKSSTRVTVIERAPDMIRSTDIDSLEEALRQGRVRPVFFEYDKADLSAEARRTLEENARWFRQYPSVPVIIEGHCDERGTEEYNLALGDRRAQAARYHLVQLGVNPDQLETLSYGEERPFAPGHDEASWALNRRAHFVVKH